MTLTVTLPTELQQRLQEEAQRTGLTADQITLRLLDQHLPPNDKSSAIGALLQSWIEEDDPAEQKETGEFLVRALDEDRLSNRKLFPPELEGVTW
ncbi:MAG TPA: hypothetical protein VK395_24835 [Gemmataceae bacterium]|nr:hypothetical protein [Gemmataceae bacterium]